MGWSWETSQEVTLECRLTCNAGAATQTSGDGAFQASMCRGSGIETHQHTWGNAEGQGSRESGNIYYYHVVGKGEKI